MHKTENKNPNRGHFLFIKDCPQLGLRKGDIYIRHKNSDLFHSVQYALALKERARPKKTWPVFSRGEIFLLRVLDYVAFKRSDE